MENVIVIVYSIIFIWEASRLRRIIISLIVLITLVLMAGTACSSRTFDVRELATIHVTGANGYGILTLKSNTSKIAEIIKEESDALRDTDEKKIKRLFIREAALNSLIFTADHMSGLKNGDEIIVRVSHDEELAKAGDVRFKNNKFKYVVEGLEEVKRIDMASEMKLVFTGFESRGTAQVVLSGDMERLREHFNITFLTSKTNLSNGSNVSVRVKADNSALTSRGYIAYEEDFTFTVSGLQALKQVDLFENLVLSYDGVSGQGTATIDTTRLPADWVDAGVKAEPPLKFAVMPASPLTNGDTVHVTATVNHEWFADRGMSAAGLSKDFTVSGLKEFPRNLDHIDLMPLFNKLGPAIEEDIQSRLIHNYWNEDSRVGQPLSRWGFEERHGVARIYYGYPKMNRADNFVALFYKIVIEGTCEEATPYQSHYEAGDRLSSTLYLVYVVDSIMYDTNRVDDFKSYNLKFHGDVELTTISQFKNQYGGTEVVIVEASVPEQVKFKDR